MAIRTRCSNCQAVYTLADHLAGKQVRCKKCEETFTVRAVRERAEADEDDAGDEEKIQTKASASKRPLVRADDEWDRPRRRDREEERDVRRSRGGSNRGLLIALIGCGAGLVLLLVGGAVVAFLLLRGQSLADNSWPVVDPPPGATDFAVLHIGGIVDPNTREAVTDRLQALGQGGNWSVTYKSQGDRITAVCTPVWDVQAFSQQLDFGTVESVKDRTITLTARKVEGPPPNADAVAKAVHQLQSPAVHKRQEAARNLKGMLPDDKRRAEVVKALEPLLNANDPFTRRAAIEAICVWANKDSVPLLLRALNAGDDFVIRGEILKALGRLKDERAAEPIAARLDQFAERDAAKEALIAMGPIAEKAVLARLTHADWQVRQAACEILIKIGTRQSLPALEKVAAAGNEGFDHFVKQKAEEAIQAIKRRR